MITAQLATIPERITLLPTVINSILPQVDRLNVMLNGYTDQQLSDLMRLWYDSLDMTIDSRLRFIRRQNQMTDGEKYYGIEDIEGYIFTIDDDIKYPPGYVHDMITKVEQYDRKFVVTLHGRVFQDLPINSYYGSKSRKAIYQCLHGFDGDHIILDENTVGCGGDGVMAWHSDTLKMRYKYVELPNMSQLWMALTCNRFKVPQMAIGHPADYLTYLWPEKLGNHQTIFEKEVEESFEQADLINTRWI